MPASCRQRRASPVAAVAILVLFRPEPVVERHGAALQPFFGPAGGGCRHHADRQAGLAVAAAVAPLGPARPRKKSGPRPKNTCRAGLPYVYAAYPIRTCLWPRADRWASGQEAGQPPGVGGRMEGDGHPLKSRLPVPPKGTVLRTAIGSRRRNRRTPNLHGGRSLKQRRNGLFLVSLVLQRPAPKRLVLHCRACGGLPQATVTRVRTSRSAVLGVSIAP